MKYSFTAFLLFTTSFLFAQQTISLSADLVLTETLTITEDVTYEGNGFAIRCDGCSPAIRVTNGASAEFNDVRFPRTYARWISVSGNSNASWNGSSMMGSISTSRAND